MKKYIFIMLYGLINNIRPSEENNSFELLKNEYKKFIETIDNQQILEEIKQKEIKQEHEKKIKKLFSSLINQITNHSKNKENDDLIEKNKEYDDLIQIKKDKIAKLFRKLSLFIHPDRHATNKGFYRKLFQTLNEQYEKSLTEMNGDTTDNQTQKKQKANSQFNFQQEENEKTNQEKIKKRNETIETYKTFTENSKMQEFEEYDFYKAGKLYARSYNEDIETKISMYKDTIILKINSFYDYTNDLDDSKMIFCNTLLDKYFAKDHFLKSFFKSSLQKCFLEKNYNGAEVKEFYNGFQTYIYEYYDKAFDLYKRLFKNIELIKKNNFLHAKKHRFLEIIYYKFNHICNEFNDTGMINIIQTLKYFIEYFIDINDTTINHTNFINEVILKHINIKDNKDNLCTLFLQFINDSTVNDQTINNFITTFLNILNKGSQNEPTDLTKGGRFATDSIKINTNEVLKIYNQYSKDLNTNSNQILNNLYQQSSKIIQNINQNFIKKQNQQFYNNKNQSQQKRNPQSQQSNLTHRDLLKKSSLSASSFQENKEIKNLLSIQSIFGSLQSTLYALGVQQQLQPIQMRKIFGDLHATLYNISKH